ncbi:hypothetical protein CL617_02140 [archaeon]|nr:hypothetical protein [archaeon]|tara:strand:- start:3706 stop:4545 length:840 start_codon:yes stop_codon:yes gene_type:complete
MLKKVIFWCEFPNKVDWTFLNKTISRLKFNIEIYVASKTLKDFQNIQEKVTSKYIQLSVWPILDMDKGYWFSGFTEKEDINSLKQFENLNIKIDLEPPVPKWKYTNLKIISLAIKQIFKKGKNNDYLKDFIYKLSKKTKVETVVNNIQLIINEFPLAKWYLKRQGMYIEPKENMVKNIMCYTTFSGQVLRPLIRIYMSLWTRRAVRKYKNKVMFSIGLIGPGILKHEKTYKNIEQFKQDLDMINNSGAEKVAIYSIEGLLKREEPERWLFFIKNYLVSL